MLVTQQKAQEIGALDYIECSALTQHPKFVYDNAILAAVARKRFLDQATSELVSTDNLKVAITQLWNELQV